MIVKGIQHEDFLQYKVPSMFIATPSCTFKCEKECGMEGMCQNSCLANQPTHDIDDATIIKQYMNNPITKAIVLGGLEPFDSFSEMYDFIVLFRRQCNSDIVIYTGYDKSEIDFEIKTLQMFPNIIIKFGRYIPNQKPHLDEVLGVELASDNQYAERIS